MERLFLPFAFGLIRGLHTRRCGLGIFLAAGFALFSLQTSVMQTGLRADDQPSATGPLPDLTQGLDLQPTSALARLGTARFRHAGPVFSVSFSQDGKVLVSGSADKTIRLWDTATGKERQCFRGHSDAVITALLAADGKTLASGSDDLTLRLWDVPSGKQLASFHVDSRIFCRNLAMAPDGKSLVTIGQDHPFRKVLRAWEVPSGKELRCVYLSEDYYYDGGTLSFSPDGTILALGRNYDAALLDPVSGKLIRRFLGHREVTEANKDMSNVMAVGFSRDGLTLVSGASDQTVRLWRVATGEQIRCFEGHRGPVRTVAIAPDGKTVASGSNDGSVRLWDVVTGKERRRFDLQRGWVHSVCFSPDGRWLVAGCDDHVVHRWDAASGQEVPPGPGHQRSILAIAYSADGHRLTTAAQDLTLYQWEAATGKDRRHGPANQPVILCTCLALAGSLVAGADEDGMIYCRDVGTKTSAARVFKGHDGAVECLALSPEAKTLASADQNGLIRLWDVATRTLVREIIPGGQNRIFGLGFSPDGKLLASEGPDGTVALWSLASGQKVLQTSATKEGWFTCFAFSRDGRNLAAGTYSGFVYVWELATGKERCHFRGQDGPRLEIPPQRGFEGDVRAIDFSPDGKLLAWGGGDRLVHLWDFTTGKEFPRFVGHQGRISALAFAPDRKTLTSGSYDTTALVWDLTSRRTGDSVESFNPSDLTRFWADLGSTDAAQAFCATQKMIRASERTLPFLKRQIHPVRPPDTEHIGRLIAQLDSTEFKKREDAERGLEKLGELAEPQLRTTLAGQPSPEVRRRLERLLQQLEGPITRPEQLRAIRVVEVLEHLGSPDARALLQTLAEGAPQARLTREAKQALDRLNRQPPRK